MGKFIRENLPDPVDYFESQGLKLIGKGKQRKTACQFHGGSDSMSINVESGAFFCFNCCAKGGDVMDYHRAAHGMDFRNAAIALGAWLEDGTPYMGRTRPTRIPAADLLRAVADDLYVCAIYLGSTKDEQEGDFDQYLAAAARIIHVAEVANA
jgi:hypothetical protein